MPSPLPDVVEIDLQKFINLLEFQGDFLFMGRREQFSPDQLPGRDLMALEGFVNPKLIDRAFEQPNLVPTKGPGKHSLRNAVERRNFWKNADPVFLYGDTKEALKRRRQHNFDLRKK